MKKSSNKTKTDGTKLFVLDTNVFLHDPNSLFRFGDNDICLPMFVLEELDGKKHGMTEVNRNARQVSRLLDEILENADDITSGIKLESAAYKNCTGRLYLQTSFAKQELPQNMELGKADNAILGVVISLQKAQEGRDVILVSKDINMRIKARALGLKVQDYKNDVVLEDTDLLYSGVLELPADFWETHGKEMTSWKKDGRTYYKVNGPLCSTFFLNQFLILEGGDVPFYARVLECDPTGQTALIATIKDYSHKVNAVMGITARNSGQNFALNLLMDPEVHCVTLLGQAGTGKTMLALASALQQKDLYGKIIITRATVPVSGKEGIGFLPGKEKDKMDPWLGGFYDNLGVLQGKKEEEVPVAVKKDSGKKDERSQGRPSESGKLDSGIEVKSLDLMRGRSFQETFVIVDEAQNLTPDQIKTLITRAGMGTKVVFMGNLAQIDTPYLSEGSSGLTYLVDRLKGTHGCELFGSVTLEGVERSPLAKYAVEVL